MLTRMLTLSDMLNQTVNNSWYKVLRTLDTFTHADMHTCTHAHMLTCKHAHMHSCTQTYTRYFGIFLLWGLTKDGFHPDLRARPPATS